MIDDGDDNDDDWDGDDVVRPFPQGLLLAPQGFRRFSLALC